MSARAPRPLPTLAIAVWCSGLGSTPLWLLSAHASAMTTAFAFDDAVLGMLISGFFLCAGLSGMTAGRLVQRRGWAAGVAAVGVVAAVAMFGIASLPTSVWLLFTLLALGAFAQALSQPAANVALVSVMPVRRQGLAFGVKQAALPVATFLAGATLPLFHGEDGWRHAYLWAAGLAAALCLTTLIARGSSATTPRQADAESHPHPARAPRLRPELRKGLLLVSVGAGFATTCTMSLGGFLVISVITQGWSAEDAGRLLAVASVTGIIARVISGHLADRRAGRHLVAVAVMMLAGVVGLVLLALQSTTALTVVGAVVAYGIGWAWNGVFAYATVIYSAGAPAVATGMAQTAMGVGAAVGPLGFGVLASSQGYSAAWLAAAAAMAIGAVFILLGRRALPPGAARLRPL